MNSWELYWYKADLRNIYFTESLTTSPQSSKILIYPQQWNHKQIVKKNNAIFKDFIGSFIDFNRVRLFIYCTVQLDSVLEVWKCVKK